MSDLILNASLFFTDTGILELWQTMMRSFLHESLGLAVPESLISVWAILAMAFSCLAFGVSLLKPWRASQQA